MAVSWKDKLAIARVIARKRTPYFGAAIIGMVFKPAPGLGTFAMTDKGVMLFDPSKVDEWSAEHIATVILHEVGHFLRKHHLRREAINADPQKWNIAGDAEINDDLIKAKMDFPVDPVTPAALGMDDGLTAEEYYRSARDQKPKKGDGDGDGDGDDEGEGSESGKSSKSGSGAGGPGNPRQTARAAQGEADGDGEGSEPHGPCCGSAAGHAHPKEGEYAGTSGRSARELDGIRRTVAEAIRTEAEKGRGTVPGGWVRWADDELKPAKVPWRSKLRHAVRASLGHKAGMVDQTFAKMSRRQAGLGYGIGRPILPGFHAPIPNVAVIVDTSGSMGSAELVAAVSETAGVIKAVGAEVRFLACDSKVHELRKVRTWKDAVAALKGGGGTDMRPAFAALGTGKDKPDIVIVCTDGQIGDLGEAPPFRVVWVILGKHGNKLPAPFGEVVVIDEM